MDQSATIDVFKHFWRQKYIFFFQKPQKPETVFLGAAEGGDFQFFLFNFRAISEHFEKQTFSMFAGPLKMEIFESR